VFFNETWGFTPAGYINILNETRQRVFTKEKKQEKNKYYNMFSSHQWN